MKTKKKDVEEEVNEDKTEEETEDEDTEDEETEEDTEKETENKSDEDEDEDEKGEDVEKEAEEVAKKVSKYLDLDSLKKKIDGIVGRDSKTARKIYSAGDLASTKKKTELTKEEKIIGFFSALVTDDKVALKALSEGVAADFFHKSALACERLKNKSVKTGKTLKRIIPCQAA